MAQVRAGGREALVPIFERYRTSIWAFFRRRTPDREAAAELTQDVFVAILEAAPRYEARGAFRSYLFGVALNVLAAWRRRVREPIAPTPLVEVQVPAVTPEPDDVLWVRQALDSLDPIDRDVLMLREYEGLKYEEIAAVLGIPINTVRSRLYRARLALKAQLDASAAPQRSHA
jgi:RNA polymerase sigma-70 factor (ECF subfamily)